MVHSRGSILARQFKDGEVAASGDAPGIIGKKKRISRKAAKTPREEGEGGLTTKRTKRERRGEL